jgi:hypothetical protein
MIMGLPTIWRIFRPKGMVVTGSFLIALAALVYRAGACPGCIMASDSFSLAHPHGIRIALATRKSLDDELISKAGEKSPDEFEEALIRATSLVSHPLTMGKPATVDVLFVDEAAIYRVMLNGRSSKVERHTTDVLPVAPMRIVTTRVVAEAIGTFQLRVAEATKYGMLETESSEPQRK